MRQTNHYTPHRYILAVVTLLACQACTPTLPTGSTSPSNISIPQVYSQSGIVKVPPYTRSIINTNNF